MKILVGLLTISMDVSFRQNVKFWDENIFLVTKYSCAQLLSKQTIYLKAGLAALMNMVANNVKNADNLTVTTASEMIPKKSGKVKRRNVVRKWSHRELTIEDNELEEKLNAFNYNLFHPLATDQMLVEEISCNFLTQFPGTVLMLFISYRCR